MRARLQHRAGIRGTPTSSVAERLAKFGGFIGDFRMLSNIWGAYLFVFHSLHHPLHTLAHLSHPLYCFWGGCLWEFQCIHGDIDSGGDLIVGPP